MVTASRTSGDSLGCTWSQVFYGFLLLWWGPGTGVLTFHGPYRTTGNPYFACWAALLCSLLLCAIVSMAIVSIARVSIAALLLPWCHAP